MSTEATIEKDDTKNKATDKKVQASSEAQKTKAADKQDAKASADNKSAANKTEPPKADTKPEKKPAKKHKQQKSGGSTVGTLALVLSLGALGGGYWLWQQLDTALDYNQQLAAELQASMEKTRNTLESNTRAQTEQLGSDVQSVTQRQQGLETQFNSLQTSIGNSTRDWKVAEAQYLLEIANHKLQLQRDITTSIAALKLADSRIRSTGEPALLPVRETIAKEITALENFAQPDTVGASLKLSSIAENIATLPLQVRVQSIGKKTATPDASADNSNDVENLPTAMWSSLKGLITIRYNERPVEPLLTPTQASNLNENIQIKLEQARLAILQGKQTVYDDNMNKAIEWLNKYYQGKDEQVIATLAQLTSLRELKVAPSLPDITTSLRELKNIARRLKLNPDDKQGGKS